MDESTFAKVKTFVQKLYGSGVLLRDEPLSSEQAEAFAKRLLEGEEEAVGELFRHALSYMCMGVAKYQNERAPYSLRSKISRENESVRPILEQMVKAGIAEEDISRVTEHYQRWAEYEAVFAFAETLESSWVSLDRLLHELGYDDSEDRNEIFEALNIYWGLAKFDEEGNFLQALDVIHESIGPDDFFETY